jgi:DNA-binding beta-propeller fold protein YncE
MRAAAGAALLASAISLVGAGPSLGHQLEPETDRGLTRMEARQAMAQISANAQPVPRADCGPGSRPEPGMQGRVPQGSPADGFTCNTSLVGRQGKAGGYKVHRFVDRAGRECAYYDTTLLFPTNAQHLSNQPTGVAVLDMSNPAKPEQTDMLSTPAMQTPHESVVLNERRGLLAAVMGNPTFYPGFVDIYDVNEDCRHPSLQSSLPVGLLGHESGFAPDGNTFYATSLSTGHVTAVDVSNPKLPKTLWVGQYRSHGLTVSNDGNRAYVAANTGLIILDVSEVQARKSDPQVREVSRLTWEELTIPQVAIPVTIAGRRYLVEIDEFSGTEEDTGPAENGSKVGAARIIDIANERVPRVVSNIRLEVHQPQNRERLADDPGASSSLQGYAGHYCSVPTRDEPGIVACSFIASGLRVFDIRDPRHPREIAYFVAPLSHSSSAGEPSNYAMSAPAFVPERREIWYSDGNTGFYAVRLARGAWPAGRPARRSCMGRRTRVGRNAIGRARLGRTRGRLLRRVRALPLRRGRRILQWCVSGSRGRVSAVFSRPGRRGRARLVVSTVRRHTRRGARRSAGRRSRRVVGVRRGRVRFVGVADRRLLRDRRALRRYLRRAGL